MTSPRPACAATSTASPGSTPSASSSAPPASAPARSRPPPRRWALDKIIELIDLTTLEGADTPGKVRSLVAKALTPDPARPDHARASRRSASTATWCPYAVAALGAAHGDPDDGLASSVAAVATAFPSGRASLARQARRHGGRGRRRRRRDRHGHRPRRVPRPAATARSSTRSSRSRRRAAAPTARYAHLKVILETGELNTYDNVAPRIVARDPRRRRLHQDLDRQGVAGRDAARHAAHARGRARLAPRSPARRSA